MKPRRRKWHVYQGEADPDRLFYHLYKGDCEIGVGEWLLVEQPKASLPGHLSRKELNARLPKGRKK